MTPPVEDRYTSRAHQVLGLAKKVSGHWNHNYIGTEHLLLAIIRLGEGTAIAVLGALGINVEKLKREVEKQIGPGPAEVVADPGIPFTPRVKKVLQLAGKEANVLNHIYVGTEHILLGLVREGDGVAARVLRAEGVELDALRAAVVKFLSNDQPAAPSLTEKGSEQWWQGGMNSIIELLAETNTAESFAIVSTILSSMVQACLKLQGALICIMEIKWTGAAIVEILAPLFKDREDLVTSLRELHNVLKSGTVIGDNVAILLEILFGAPQPRTIPTQSLKKMYGLEQSAEAPAPPPPTPPLPPPAEPTT